MKTRKELARLGIELLGPIVPDWFKFQSDGGSVPGGRVGRWLFKETQWRAAAFIHDFRYYLIALLLRSDLPAWVGVRMEADFELQKNRKLCAKNRFIGWAYSRIIFRGVRISGANSIRLPAELVVPPTLKAIEEIERLCLEYYYARLTDQAKEQVRKWKESL